MELHKISGLSNVPSRSVTTKLLQRIKLCPSMPPLTRLLQANSSTLFNDDLSFYGASAENNLFHFRTNVMIMSNDNMPVAQLASSGGSLPLGIFKYEVSQMLAHPSLPLVALIMPEAHLIQVYRLSNPSTQSHPRV